MDAARNFWRLLADYERLTQNESVSLAARDFVEVESIQSCKDLLLVKLESYASEAQLDRRNAELSSRIDVVIESERRNEKLIGAMVARASLERRSLEAARQRLRELGSAYLFEKSGRTAFSAHV